MKGRDFAFNFVEELFYKWHKVSFNCGGSHIDSPNSPKWLKNKKATINPQNINDMYFKYRVTATLNHESIGKHPERIAKTYIYQTIVID